MNFRTWQVWSTSEVFGEEEKITQIHSVNSGEVLKLWHAPVCSLGEDLFMGV